jgi:hypothetical protein
MICENPYDNCYCPECTTCDEIEDEVRGFLNKYDYSGDNYIVDLGDVVIS